jgi:TolB-like protein
MDAKLYDEIEMLRLPLDKGDQVSPGLAACLNILPGFGDFYLAINTDHGSQWTFGIINLALWPRSIAWGIPQAAIDAVTINKINTVAYYRYDPEGQAMLREARGEPVEPGPPEEIMPVKPKKPEKAKPLPPDLIEKPKGFEPIPKEKRPKVAVFNFKDKTPGAKTNYGDIVAKFFHTALFHTECFRLIEREQISKVLQEQNFAASEMVDQTTAVEIGKLLKVEYILIGSVAKMGTIYNINARIISITTGETAAAAPTGKAHREEDIDETVTSMAYYLGSKFR